MLWPSLVGAGLPSGYPGGERESPQGFSFLPPETPCEIFLPQLRGKSFRPAGDSDSPPGVLLAPP
jgi:hypothetical protein